MQIEMVQAEIPHETIQLFIYPDYCSKWLLLISQENLMKRRQRRLIDGWGQQPDIEQLEHFALFSPQVPKESSSTSYLGSRVPALKRTD
jgi:hypothetical protein